jgi:CRISPR-associated protein Cas1
MNIVISTFGAYLHREGELFLINIPKEEKREVSSRKVRSILIATGASLSTDAIQLAIERNIDIVFMDKYGDPYGRIWHGKLGSTTAIRRLQLQIGETEAGFKLAQSWIIRKIDNQIDYLILARQKRSRLSEALSKKIDKLRESEEKVTALSGTLDEMREKIFLLEAHAAQQYWEAVNLLLPEQYHFKERSKRPATDEFNCLLNYAYGVLYNAVERACILAGLDPYVGFIHTDGYNKVSLVFDLIECYRIWAEEIVIGLFAARQVKKELFFKLHNGLTLDKEGKKVLMTAFETFLDTKIRYRNRNIQRRETIQLDCHNIANQLLGKENETD